MSGGQDEHVTLDKKNTSKVYEIRIATRDIQTIYQIQDTQTELQSTPWTS
jgi:hypothetical protein